MQGMALALWTISGTDTPGPALARCTWFEAAFRRLDRGGGPRGFCPEADLRERVWGLLSMKWQTGSTRVELGVQVLPSSEGLSEFPANACRYRQWLGCTEEV